MCMIGSPTRSRWHFFFSLAKLPKYARISICKNTHPRANANPFIAERFCEIEKGESFNEFSKTNSHRISPAYGIFHIASSSYPFFHWKLRYSDHISVMCVWALLCVLTLVGVDSSHWHCHLVATSIDDCYTHFGTPPPPQVKLNFIKYT